MRVQSVFTGFPRSSLTISAVAISALTLVSCATVQPDEAAASLSRADRAMGGTGLKSIRYAGSGTGATFGQAFQPNMTWPKIVLSSFSRVHDYDNGSFREDAARSRAEPTGGGAVPLIGTGEQRTTGLMRDSFAWNMTGPAPVAAPLTVTARIHDLWTSPHGVIKAALKNKSTVQAVNEGGRALTAISFEQAGTFKATAMINAEGLVERVESMLPNPVLGDTVVTTQYSDYKDFNGVKFPMRIRQSMARTEVLDLTVSEVQVNAAANIEVPELVKTAAERVTADKVAEGVWMMGGGSHNSVAIEMGDHMMLVEAPLYDGRTLPMLAEVKKLNPAKPIRFVVNSHHHFDHAGGLRSAASEGIELVTSAQAKPYFERVMTNPNSISPDALQKSGRKAVVSGVDGKRVFTDAKRVAEVYFIDSSVHAQGFLMVYLPAEKLLIEADAFTPGAPNSPPPARVNDNHVNLVQNIERLKLNVERIVPLHGRVVPIGELYAAIGRTKP
jgi:glyoxylase-like metal-dependent hydrolase (beta-lactamase superfamily II)